MQGLGSEPVGAGREGSHCKRRVPEAMGPRHWTVHLHGHWPLQDHEWSGIELSELAVMAVSRRLGAFTGKGGQRCGLRAGGPSCTLWRGWGSALRPGGCGQQRWGTARCEAGEGAGGCRQAVEMGVGWWPSESWGHRVGDGTFWGLELGCWPGAGEVQHSRLARQVGAGDAVARRAGALAGSAGSLGWAGVLAKSPSSRVTFFQGTAGIAVAPPLVLRNEMRSDQSPAEAGTVKNQGLTGKMLMTPQTRLLCILPFFGGSFLLFLEVSTCF